MAATGSLAECGVKHMSITPLLTGTMRATPIPPRSAYRRSRVFKPFPFPKNQTSETLDWRRLHSGIQSSL